MATQTVTYTEHNLLGNLREDYGTWTSDGAAGDVKTRLSWIYSVHLMTPGTANQSMDVYPNSQTASTTEDDAGSFYYANGNAVAMKYRCVGK